MSTKNLMNTEAQKKIKEMAESIDFALLSTALNRLPIHTVPMSTKEVDTSGTIWFLSSQQSDHNRHIKENGQCQLHYANPSSMEFLVLFGASTIIEDRERIKELYGSTDDAWFDGPDDRNLTAIRFAPLEGHYWDSKNSKLVTLMKMGTAALTGIDADIGRHGQLKI